MNYTIGDVEELTGVKSHILRYWETVVPGFAPSKDLTGRRSYTEHEVQLIFRIKYLIQEKKFTPEGAGRQILEEAGEVQANRDLIQQIRQTRADLAALYLKIKEHRNG